MSRVAVSDVDEAADDGERADKWTSVGKWACAGDNEGLGCVSMTILKGLRDSLEQSVVGGFSLVPSRADSGYETGAVVGAFSAAKASRCRVTLLMPTSK